MLWFSVERTIVLRDRTRESSGMNEVKESKRHRSVHNGRTNQMRLHTATKCTYKHTKTKQNRKRTCNKFRGRYKWIEFPCFPWIAWFCRTKTFAYWALAMPMLRFAQLYMEIMKFYSRTFIWKSIFLLAIIVLSKCRGISTQRHIFARRGQKQLAMARPTKTNK